MRQVAEWLGRGRIGVGWRNKALEWRLLIRCRQGLTAQQAMAIGTAGYTAMPVMTLERYGVPKDGEVLGPARRAAWAGGGGLAQPVGHR